MGGKARRVRKIRRGCPSGINTAPTERNTNSNYEYLGSGSKRHRKSLTGFRQGFLRPDGNQRVIFCSLSLLPPCPCCHPLAGARFLIAPTGPPSAEYQPAANPFRSYFRINPLPFPHLISCRKLISNYALGICAGIEKRGWRSVLPRSRLLAAGSVCSVLVSLIFEPRYDGLSKLSNEMRKVSPLREIDNDIM